MINFKNISNEAPYKVFKDYYDDAQKINKKILKLYAFHHTQKTQTR